jgi:DNA-directed RNA polymerase III subunit RPC3
MTSLSIAIPKIDMEVVGNPANCLMHYLDALATYEPNILVRQDDRGGGEYCVKLLECTRELKLRLILSIAQEDCGMASCRIWKLLLMKNKLDEKQISKFVLMHDKVVRQLLYQLLKIGFVFIQVT